MSRRIVTSFVALAMMLLVGLPVGAGTASAASPDLVISQVYGGGGNAGAPFNADFAEIFNRGTAAVSLGGKSIQYASATGTGNLGIANQITVLPAVTLNPGQYFLVQEASGATGAPLTPDHTSSPAIAMAAGAGKIALVNSTTSLGCNGGSTPCSPAQTALIIDLVGYGNATFFEGSAAAPTLSNTTSAQRLSGGCQDTDSNAADFAAGAPTPRNTASPARDCNEQAPSVTSTSPVNGASDIGVNANIAVTFSEPVNVTGASFAIACTNTGGHLVSLSGGPTTYVLDPTDNFGANETCSVTVFGAQVSDQDANDPPDTMTGDESLVFSTTSEACDAPATFIHQVQGSGSATSMAGSVRSVEGIVVGDYQGPGQFSGYYVQEEDLDADTDPATSEGIFVFNTATPVSLGDKVRVRGTVGEFSGLTQLSSVSSVLVCTSGGSVTPTAVTLPVSAVSFLERYEGMRISIAQELTVTETFTLGRFGEVVLSVGGRLDNPTNVVEPGAPAIALQDLNNRSRIVLDDGNNLQNIDPTFYPQGGLSATNTLRVGDTLPSLSGVLDFRFSLYRIQPVDTSAIAFTSANPRPLAPASVGGNLRVSAFNVLNYFNGNGLGGGFPTARGATTPFEFDRQRDKIISAMTALDADVIGLMELENDATGNSAIEDLVAGLNAATAPGTYGFVDTGIVGTDAIRVGILYQPAVVTPVGGHAILNSTVDPRFIDTLNRPAIAQTFDLVATGGRFTVVVNHLKSKGSDCNAVGDPDIGDGQGNCNLTRTAAAEALVDWLASDPTGSGDPDVLVIGDLNAYAKEDPIQVFERAGYENTIDAFLGDHAYSFVFQGQSGYLDHALASASLAGQVTGVTEWHVNADEPIVLDYNTEFKTTNQVNTFYDDGPYRSSDHDPVLVGLDLNASPTVDAGGPYAVVEGGSVIVTASGTDPDGGTLAYAWDLDNDGTFETSGQSATFSAAGLQAPAQRTIRVRATDAGGLIATDTAIVNVVFGFSGFLPPVDASPDLNAVRAGSAVPIKFRLGGDQGLAILAAGSPVSMPFPCAAGASADPIAETETPGNAVLSYDASTDTYTYVWKTVKTWSGCRRFVLTLADGTVHFADFKFN
jgi:predicted extracellular nuclease